MKTQEYSIVLIGDIGGHLSVFRRILSRHNIDPTNPIISSHMIVIQVGDLVHKGPDSEECVELAKTLLENNPHNYIQLVGNHEAHYLQGPDVSSRKGVHEVSKQTIHTLQEWWQNGSLKVAAALRDEYGQEYLITHGGLTAGLWQELGSPATAVEAVEKLSKLRRDPSLIFRPGWLMTGTVDYAAGITGPRTGAELAASWLELDSDMPFNQIHGHEGVWSWRKQSWHEDVPPSVREVSVINPVKRFTTVHVPGGTLKSIDWTLGETLTPNFIPSSDDMQGQLLDSK